MHLLQLTSRPTWFLLMAVSLVFLLFGSVSAKMGLLGNCDFVINQIHLPPEDFQFYSDWPEPPSWITYQGISISSHPATRHFWLFMQVEFDQVDQVMAQAVVLCRELREILSRASDCEDVDLGSVLAQALLDDFRQDVVEKGGYFEVIVVYHPQAPHPNAIADFQMAYPQATYFYLLLVYNLEMGEITDLTWSDFQVAVTLSSFTASAGQGQVVLRWTTESERQNLGFNLLRSSGSEDPFVKINQGLIPSAGQGCSEMPLHYHFADRDVSLGMTYQYQLEDVNFQGERSLLGVVAATPLASRAVPHELHLLQNYPNPFNTDTEIRYKIPQGIHAIISIYDVRGELVAVLVDDFQPKGEYSVRWDGLTSEDHVASSGLYFCVLQVGEHQQVRKMVLLR